MSDMTITKREVLASIVIICVMLLIGTLFSSKISDAVMEKQQEYSAAVKIDNDHDMFVYCMDTNVGNAFVYGELKAVDPVTYEEIGGEYSYVKKVKERYTRHTRTVTKTRTVNGKTQTYTTTEVYWTWDEIDRWSKSSTKIEFVGVEFDYGKIPFPFTSHIKTIKESSKIRYVYSGAPAQCDGTIYAKLGDGDIQNVNMYHYSDVNEAFESAMSDWSVGFFWFFWIVLTGFAVGGFYYLENRWLE